jgi:glucosamine--fructose-6-phosphate aminotransferase (isomerizing)
MLGTGAAYALEGWSGILTEAIEAAELVMYRMAALNAETLVIAISSSGKSLTVVEAARGAAERGAAVAALTNSVPSPLADAAPRVLQTQAGPSNAYPTKQTTTALAVLYALALELAEARGTMPAETIAALKKELAEDIPNRMSEALAREKELEDLAAPFVNAPMYTFLGNGVNLATAMLGSAKMVETSQSSSRATNLEEFSQLYSYTLTEGEPVVYRGAGAYGNVWAPGHAAAGSVVCLLRVGAARPKPGQTRACRV